MAKERYISGEVDGATAIGHELDTTATIINPSAKLISIKNAGNEKFSVSSEGGINIRRSATAVSANSAGEVIIGVTDTSAARTITLDSDDVVAGRIMIIKDESGAAGTNNITIDTEGAETIDGAASVTISVNYGVVRVYSDGTNWFTI